MMTMQRTDTPMISTEPHTEKIRSLPGYNQPLRLTQRMGTTAAARMKPRAMG